MSKEAFSLAVEDMLQMQKKLKRPPHRHKVNRLVHSLVKKHHLRHDPRREYFELLATCALLGLEAMYYNYQSKRRK